jgi:DNA polymerase III subunit delta'
MAWQGIEGHDAIAERFVAAHARGRVSGSYLFIGPPASARERSRWRWPSRLPANGRAPARGLRGLRDRACRPRRQPSRHRHRGKPEDRSTIPLELLIGDDEHRMREGLCWRILLRPALGGRGRWRSSSMPTTLSDEAANCLLKTLEEPPTGAVIILVGTTLERQLPTIRSRCQIVRFQPLEEEAVLRHPHAEDRGRWSACRFRPASTGAPLPAAAVWRAGGCCSIQNSQPSAVG